MRPPVACVARPSLRCAPHSLRTTTPRLQAINAGADIVETSFSKVDLDRVLGIHAFSLDKLLIKDPEFLVGVNPHLHCDAC